MTGMTHQYRMSLFSEVSSFFSSKSSLSPSSKSSKITGENSNENAPRGEQQQTRKNDYNKSRDIHDVTNAENDLFGGNFDFISDTSGTTTMMQLNDQKVAQSNNSAALLPEEEVSASPPAHAAEVGEAASRTRHVTLNETSKTMVSHNGIKRGTFLDNISMPQKKKMRFSQQLNSRSIINNDSNSNSNSNRNRNRNMSGIQDIESNMYNFFQSASDWTNSFGRNVSHTFHTIGTNIGQTIGTSTGFSDSLNSKSNSKSRRKKENDTNKNVHNSLNAISVNLVSNSRQYKYRGEKVDGLHGSHGLHGLTPDFVNIDLSWLNDLLNTDKNKNKNKRQNRNNNKESKSMSKLITSSSNMDENGVKNSQMVISEVWTQLTGEKFFQRIFDSKHWKVAQIWSQLCHRIDLGYPNKLQAIDKYSNKNIELLSNARYSMKHSLCAYPPIFLVYLLSDVRYAMKSAKSVISETFNIDCNKDIIKYNLGPLNPLHNPSYYLCIDHNRHNIVLTIRGSATIADVLTDANFESKEFFVRGRKEDGKENGNKDGTDIKDITDTICGRAHEGILASTRWIYKETRKDLIDICTKYPSYQCIFTGHSLGGGCASLLGLLYKDDEIVFKQNRLNVFSFASPCIVSKNIAQYANDYIFSFILGTDIITRLSLQSVLLMYKRFDLIQAILDSEESKKLQAEKNFKQKEKQVKTLKQQRQQREAAAQQKEKEKQQEQQQKQQDQQPQTLLELMTSIELVRMLTNDDSGNNINSNNSNSNNDAKLLEKEIESLNGLKKDLDRFRDSQRLISRCMNDLDDESIDKSNSSNSSNNEIRAFLLTLKEMQPVVDKDELYPAGKLLWFVPDIVLEKNDIKRKELLMQINEDGIANNEIDCNAMLGARFSSFNLGIEKFRQSFFGSPPSQQGGGEQNQQRENWKQIKTKDEILVESKVDENDFEYNYSCNYITGRTDLTRFKNYILCDATENRLIFQQLVCEFYDSFYSHMPTRYMEVLNIKTLDSD